MRSREAATFQPAEDTSRFGVCGNAPPPIDWFPTDELERTFFKTGFAGTPLPLLLERGFLRIGVEGKVFPERGFFRTGVERGFFKTGVGGKVFPWESFFFKAGFGGNALPLLLEWAGVEGKAVPPMSSFDTEGLPESQLDDVW